MRTRQLNGLLVVAILLISTAPLYAQRQQQNVAKLKADARNLVGIIGSDKTKTQTYCQIDDLSEQLIQAIQEKDRKKANAPAEKITELYKKMGPEFAALIDIKKRVDLNSRDGQEIASIIASLGESYFRRSIRTQWIYQHGDVRRLWRKFSYEFKSLLAERA
jgi:hypothetical protein